MSGSEQTLATLLEAIFEDGIVEVDEREQLARASSSLDAAVVASVFKAFLHRKWGEVIADDVLTAQERLLLGRIVAELHLSQDDLPPQARMALRDL